MTSSFDGFCCHVLDDEHALYSGRLPPELLPDDAAFERLWLMHPAEYNAITIHGRRVAVPRWQQAYGADYFFTGQVSRAIDVPRELQPLLDWARVTIDPRLNGLLLNWYDGSLGHYIGRHRDSIANMVRGAPIVTISLGEKRTFRLRPKKANALKDFPASHGTVFIMPYATNRAWNTRCLIGLATAATAFPSPCAPSNQRAMEHVPIRTYHLRPGQRCLLPGRRIPTLPATFGDDRAGGFFPEPLCPRTGLLLGR